MTFLEYAVPPGAWEEFLLEYEAEFGLPNAPKEVPAPDEAVPPEPTPTPPNWIPEADNPTTYGGLGLLPKWSDVNSYTATQIQAKTPDLNTAQPVTGQQVANAIAATSGETIKALSGFFNQLTDLEVSNKTDTNAQIEAVKVATYTELIKTWQRIQVDEDVLAGVLQVEIPKLQGSIADTRDAALVAAENAVKLSQQWATDNIFKPLEEKIAQLQASSTAQVQQLRSDVPNIIKEVVPTLGLATIASVATVATQVSTLVAEDEACVQPMCDTMGPATNLGKLLKALNIAADAALLAELLGMNEHDLAALITSLVGRFAGLVSDFESFFTDGTETIGGLLTGAIGNAL